MQIGVHLFALYLFETITIARVRGYLLDVAWNMIELLTSYFVR